MILLGAQVALALQRDGWWLRNEIVWYKRGVRPENVSDRFTRTHEKIYLLTKSDKHRFAQDEVREPSSRTAVNRRTLRGGNTVRVWEAHPLGRNPRDVWEFATSKYTGEHPATFPPELVRRCLKASCPPGGQVLDPFAGSGTTGLVALEFGSRSTLIDLNPAYIKEARQRLASTPQVTSPNSSLTPTMLNQHVSLYQGNCRDVLPVIPSETIDVMIADLPYNLDVPAKATVIDHFIAKNGMRPRFRQQWDRFEGADDYQEFADNLLGQAQRVLAPAGSIFIFAVSTNLGLIDIAARRVGLNIIHHIVWLKRNPTPMLSTRRLQFSHETIIWCAKSLDYTFNYDELKAAAYDGDRLKVAGKQHKDVVETNTASNESLGHPAQKPVGLYSRLLDIAGRQGGILLDPCAGSGTSAIAAAERGMKAILIESDPDYVSLIKRRVGGAAIRSQGIAGR